MCYGGAMWGRSGRLAQRSETTTERHEMTEPVSLTPVQNAGALIGRVLLGAIFVWFGFLKATAATAAIAGFAKLGLPMPTMAYAVAVTIELGIGVLFIAGFFTRPAALVLAFWCIATAIAGHSNFSDRNMLIHFFKNVSMCGGFLYAAILGPGAYSIDAVIKARFRSA